MEIRNTHGNHYVLREIETVEVLEIFVHIHHIMELYDTISAQQAHWKESCQG